MRLLFLILIFGTAHGQSATIIQTSRTLNVKTYSRTGVQTGFLSFDSLTGKLVRSGDQVAVFRKLIRSNYETDKRLQLAYNVLQWIDSTGNIKYPIEFLEDLKKWYRN